jgi:hypothetical protein
LIGKNMLWCSRQHGHSVQVMLSTYGVWIEGASEADIAAIKASFEAEATGARLEREVSCTTLCHQYATNTGVGTPKLEKN